ncbi:MAG: hypothetical protein WB624_08630 [Xanthobacteraceae bacterium]|jgi:hypothetical protein
MDTAIRSDNPILTDAVSAVSWASIAAGAVTISAVTMPLLALGAGLGLSSISPWTDSGVSASTFKVAAGIYLVIVAVMSSAIGGYLAARLRTKWIGVHTNEVFFRDTAHGFIAWAFAVLISAGLLGAATTHLLGGAASVAGATAAQAATSPAQVYVDRLFRREAPAANAASAGGAATPAPAGGSADARSSGPARAEVLRLWTTSYAAGGGLSAGDRTYVAQLVAAQTGMSQADAEKRVDDVIAQAKTAADQARRGAAKLAFWLTAALLFGAFAASLAAVEGGQLRDGTWNERRLVPRPW